MTTRSLLKVLGAGALLLSAIVAIAADHAAKKKPVDLGGPERYSTHVSTDKPVYRPGESFYARAVVLRADTRAPLPGGQQQQAQVEVIGPKGDVVASGFAQIQDSVGGISWAIPPTLPGGQDTVKFSHPWTGHTPGTRAFDVRSYRAPRLKSQIVFLRDGYGPGDTASASIHVDRAEGGVPANAKVTAVARVDGTEVHRGQTTIDANGNASARFKLPTNIARGEGTLAFVVEDGGVLETATKTIPILLQTVDLTMYPEGGDLVAGLPSRLYIEAFTPARKPADLKGTIVDSKGNQVAALATEHEGRGRFEFTPAMGEHYTLKIQEPAGIKTTYPLPAAKEDGVALRADRDTFEAGTPIRLSVASATPRKLKVTLSKREVEVASLTKEIALADGPAAFTSFELTPPATADGVLIATAWDEQGKPLAERLVFRKPAKQINVKVEADKSTYVPADAVRLTVTTTDPDGKPIGAVVGLGVSDDSVLEMIEKREQAPGLPVMVLLEGDVKELADAHVYLDPADPKAPRAVDLLLGTQGWRRFAFIDPVEFISRHGDDGRRVLAMKVVTEREIEARQWRFAVPLAAAAGPEGASVPDLAANANGVEQLAVPADAFQQAAAVPAREPEPRQQLADRLEIARELRDAQDQQRADKELGKALDEARAAGGRARLHLAGASGSRNDFLAIREYAHAAKADRKPNDRVDFTETLYWNAAVKTDERTGTAYVRFDASDAVTAFRVSADAFAADGALGAASTAIESVQPFYAEPKLPLQVTQGDVIRLPLSLVNGTSNALARATISANADRAISISESDPFDIGAKERVRRIVEVTVGDYVGLTDFTLDARAGAFSDRIIRKLDVRPAGFPIEVTHGGLLGPSNSVRCEVEIPKDVVAGSVVSELSVFPTPLANMTQALEQLIQQPYGCFEQTSSTSYPLVMAQQYFMTHAGVDPKLIDRSREILEQSYQRLVGFECKTTKGFEWFGADPGHEALSAYGLLQFTDMAQVRGVDPRILKETRAFVLKQRDGKGGFKRERPTLHTWVTDPECSNGYILWSLLEAGEKPAELEKELAAFKELALKSPNSYAIALGANIFALSGDGAAARSLMDKLAAKQTREGFVDGATQSVIGSGGEALNIETAALAALAWMRQPAFAMNVEKSVKWLAESCKGGRYGSTQSTVLALKAVVAYDKMRAKPKNAGVLRVLVDGQPFGVSQRFGTDTQGAIALQNIAEALTPGKHTVEIQMEEGSQMPFALLVRFNRIQPDSADRCKVTIATALRNPQVTEGNVTEMNVVVTNRDAATVPNPIAIVGIPGGLEVRHDQLKELVKSNRIAAFEVIGREVILYWRDLKADEKVELPLSLVAAIPGQYAAPASRAYLYYTDEFKHWVPGVDATITPKDQ